MRRRSETNSTAVRRARGRTARFRTKSKKKPTQRIIQRKHLQEIVMRHLISGLVAAVAVTAAAPAMACGFTPCAAPVYAASVYSYSGCNPCGGWAHERLPDPEVQYAAPQHYGSQYYYVNQGPTYTGPGDWAPRPTYREGAVYGYRHHYRPRYSHS